ncbi:crossover junction endodeoxyribonuclease ruvC [Candidatus Omnitrophus magneticus]|uniref:Crossover junction endodeoxyribonuclease RuvC n=1 Tax=Candidatus Omnitrophus magneticus TaxID=1609969 RepID=A0A0F0CPX7_9BACT|nr:crossover junction endodeoxyribonuclease ruvC [Candidatus Omnitrophus magneticus]
MRSPVNEGEKDFVIILGVDPGLLKTGYGVINAESRTKLKLIEAGVIRTSPSSGISARVTDIFNNLSDIIKEHHPSALVLEKIYSHYAHPATSILMGHARGVVCLAAGVNHIRLVNYAATRIKKAVTGNGRASKIQIQRTVKAILNLNTCPKYNDITDALSMAISLVYIEGVPKHVLTSAGNSPRLFEKITKGNTQ